VVAASLTEKLDTAQRGGVVNALVGWGFYNTTTNSFAGGAKNPGGLISQVPMKYSGSNGTWTGLFNATALPALQTGTNFALVLNAADKAQPPNTGFALLTMPPATVQNVTTTSTALSTTVSTVLSTTTATATSTATSVSTATATTTATATATATSTSTNTLNIPSDIYAGMAILLIVGLIVGYIMRMPRK